MGGWRAHLRRALWGGGNNNSSNNNNNYYYRNDGVLIFNEVEGKRQIVEEG